MTVSFVGHACVSGGAAVAELVKKKMRRLAVGRERVSCYFGGYGEFDAIALSACRAVQKECGNIELVYVAPYMTLSEQAKIKEMRALRLYDSFLYPPIEGVPPRFAIIKRNEWMMASADLVIAYVKRSSGGAYRALLAAKRKRKDIINIFELLLPENV